MLTKYKMKKLCLSFLLVGCVSLYSWSQSVVINKIYNATSTFDGDADMVELLVIEDHLDMRGMIVKDLSLPDANTDAGGKYKFNNIPLWADLRKGTTIVLRRLRSQDAGYAEDIDPSDFKIDVILTSSTTNAPYLTPIQANVGGQHLNITNNEIIMIKRDDGTANGGGVAQTIHAFATGNSNASSYYTQLQNAGVPILYSSSVTGTGSFQYPQNPAKALADYNGTKATVSTDANRGWGVGFGQNNIDYIVSLRVAFIINAPSDLNGEVENDNALKLTWTDNSNNEQGFAIEKSTDGTNFTNLTTVAANTTTFTETNFNPAALAFYRVSATHSSGNSTYSNVFSTAVLATPGVVINKIYNATSTSDGNADAIELLVTENNFDLRNLIVKDAEDNLTRDAGGKYQFNNIPFWANLRAGTTIVLRRMGSLDAGYAEDTDASDFTLDLIMDNTAYFTAVHLNGHRFNITNTDMVVIKSGDKDGFDNVIHAFATNNGGAASSLYHSVNAPNLVSPSITGTGSFQYPTNPDKNISDYNGLKAAASSDPNQGWGVGFGQNNIDYITYLRNIALFPAPTNLVATVAGATTVNLTWVDNSTNEDGFQIERSLNGTNFTLLTTVAANATSYEDNSVIAATTYYYRVRAIAGTLNSVYTNRADVTAGAGIITDVNFNAVNLYENAVVNTSAGTLSVQSPDPNVTVTYSLVTGAGNTDNASFKVVGNQLQTNAVLNFEQQATYSVRVRATSQSNFTIEEAFTINLLDVNEKPTITAIGNQVVCAGTDERIITLTGITPGPETTQTLTASISSDQQALFQSLQVNLLAGGNGEIRYTLNTNAVGTPNITLTLKDNGGTANGGVDTHTESFALNVFEIPTATINSDKGTTVDKGVSVKLTATGGTVFQWESHSSIIGDVNAAEITVRPQANTTYRVTVSNAGGCSSTAEFTINVNDNFNIVTAANLVSPNGDGVNDFWIIKNIDMYPESTVRVFDKTGRVIFNRKGYQNDWDGRIAGSSLKADTYYYIIDFGSGLPKKKGAITMMSN
jgi:gliding motility-associated-like protein